MCLCGLFLVCAVSLVWFVLFVRFVRFVWLIFAVRVVCLFYVFIYLRLFFFVYDCLYLFFYVQAVFVCSLRARFSLSTLVRPLPTSPISMQSFLLGSRWLFFLFMSPALPMTCPPPSQLHALDLFLSIGCPRPRPHPLSCVLSTAKTLPNPRPHPHPFDRMPSPSTVFFRSHALALALALSTTCPRTRPHPLACHFPLPLDRMLLSRPHMTSPSPSRPYVLLPLDRMTSSLPRPHAHPLDCIPSPPQTHVSLTTGLALSTALSTACPSTLTSPSRLYNLASPSPSPSPSPHRLDRMCSLYLELALLTVL